MRKKFNFEPQSIGWGVTRHKVLGGWLVVIKEGKTGVTSQFIADKHHHWEVMEQVVVESDLPSEG